jgi:NAD(P)-dependent dehydrogenase (short-subunit alcohol dehydrogenase family)
MSHVMNSNRVVLITGAAGGIGTALVGRFLSNNDTVLATDLDEEVLDGWRPRWPQDARIVTAAADVCSEEDVERVARLVRERFGRLDVLINCAGYFPVLDFEAMTTAQWRRIIDVNLTGTYLMTRALVPLMKEQGSGRIINFSSASIYTGVAEQVAYVAAKAGVIGFTRSLAHALGDHGITVNSVTPGLTATQAVRDNFPEAFLQGQRDVRALHRDEEPEDLAGPVFFLASDDAAFLTGQTLNVDGGSSMH